MDMILTFLSMAIFLFILPITINLIQDGKKWSALGMFAFLYVVESCLIYIGYNI